MARKADSPCAGGCGALLWLGRGSKARGEAVCRECRKSGSYRYGRRAPERQHGPYPQQICACGGLKSYAAKQCANCFGNAYKGLPHTWFYIPQDVRLIVFERDAYVCTLCALTCDVSCHYNAGAAPTIDHILPRSKGGTHEIDNLRTAHRSCNGKRGNRA